MMRPSGGSSPSIVIFFLLALILSGCCITRDRGDDFVTLHREVRLKMEDRCEVGVLSRDKELCQREFEVVPRGSNCRILVFERPYLTQEQWQRRHSRAMNRIDGAMFRTNSTGASTTREIDAAMELSILPEWSYGRTGVHVTLQQPEVVYPGWEKDKATAQKVFDEVVLLLTPYRSAASK